MANWYVDNAATGANSGASWTDAWESFADIAWAGMSAGDTVHISGGAVTKTYSERMDIGKGGSDGSPISIVPGVDSGHTGIVIIARGGGANSANAGFYEPKSWTTIDGDPGSSGTRRFKVTSPSAGVWVSSQQSGIIVNMVEVDDSDGYSAIRLTNCLASSVRNCKITNAQHGGITLGAVAGTESSNTIYGNEIETDAYDGISCDGGTDIYENWVKHTSSETASHPDGIAIQGGTVNIYRNVVEGFNQQIYLDAYTGDIVKARVYRNLLYCGTLGVNIADYKGMVIIGEAATVTLAEVMHNVIYDGGIRCGQAIGTVTVKNNIIDTGFSTYGDTGTPTYDIDYNRYVTADSFSWNDKSYGSLSAWQTASSQDAHSTSGNAGLYNPATDCYYPIVGSAVIDQGDALAAPYASDALDATSVWPDSVVTSALSGTADVGAYEYSSAGLIEYYVDYVGGDDTNNGTAELTPFKHCPGDANATDTALATTLASGNVVYFKRGVTYSGHIDTEAAGVTYTTTTWGTGVATINGTGSAACIDVSHGDCTITGGTAETLKLTGADIKAAVHVYNATSGVNGLTVSYCTFEDIGTSGSQERIGLKVGGSEDEYQNIAIFYCTFTNCVYYAIKISGNPTHDVTIHHNTITNCGSAGGCQINVSQSGTTGSGIYDCSIYSNTIHTGAGTSGGINVLNPGVSVYSNTIYGHTAHGLLFTFNSYAQEGTASIYKNLIRDNAGVGIKINYTTAAKYCKVYNNLICRNGSDADLSINTYADSNIVYNNSIYSDSGITTAAIWCSVSSNLNTIKNNAVYSTSKPCLLEASGDTVEDYNVFYRVDGATVSYGGTPYTVLATYRTAKSQGAHSVWSDPLFPSPGGNDFAITDGSPCVDAGMDASAVLTDDYAGTARGATYDVGAYEYVPGVDPPGFHVLYVGNGSLTGDVPSDSTDHTTGSSATVCGNTGNLARETYYAWMNWNTAADGTGTNYYTGDPLSIGSADVVLYAVWRSKCAIIV